MNKQYPYLLCLLFSALAFSTSAQTTVITCTTEQNVDRSIRIYAESNAYGDYTLKLSFPTLSGYRASGVTGNTAIVLVTRGKREILKLVPEPNASINSYNYRYQYFAGNALRKKPSDSNFVYLLPGTPENIVRIGSVNSLQDRLGQKNSTNFYSTSFHYATGDTICAARAGIVYECSDEVKESEKGVEVFRSNRNRIGIQQKDGTLAHYVFRSPIQLLVQLGDRVIPGQPIAFFNKASEQYSVMFSVNYLDEKKILAEDLNNSQNATNPFYPYLPTLFCVSEDGQTNPLQVTNQTFKISHPTQLIGIELSKKEKKKLGL